MTQEALFAEITSRPKIHRLPNLPAPVSDADKRFMQRALYGCAVMVAVAIIGIVYQSQERIASSTVKAATRQAVTEQIELANSTIYIKGKDGVIVGQMAKIPQEPENAADLKNISTVNQPAGRDLLAIISKY